jgi:hypothetical protein
MISELHKRLTKIEEDRRSGLLTYKLSQREYKKQQRRERKKALRLKKEAIFKEAGGDLNKLFSLIYGPFIKEAASQKPTLLNRLMREDDFQGGEYAIFTDFNSDE